MRRLAPLLLLVPVLAACGSTREQRFVSRPDLRPPALVVTTREPAAAPGYVFLAPKRHAQQKGPLIVDRGGGIAWFHPLEAEATDFRVQRYRGRPVLTWWQGHSARGFGSGEYVIADETYRRVATVRAGNGLAGDEHEFQLTPRGTALITIYHREGRVLDSIVQEVEVASGRVLLEWRSIDHVPPAESYVPLSAGGGSSPLAKGDYFHVNSLEVEPDGNLLVSARNTSALYEIDRRTGEVLWRLGGKRSDFRMGPGTRFAWQHDARRQPDGTITLFDDEAAPPLGKRSRAIRLRLDTTAM